MVKHDAPVPSDMLTASTACASVGQLLEPRLDEVGDLSQLRHRDQMLAVRRRHDGHQPDSSWPLPEGQQVGLGADLWADECGIAQTGDDLSDCRPAPRPARELGKIAEADQDERVVVGRCDLEFAGALGGFRLTGRIDRSSIGPAKTTSSRPMIFLTSSEVMSSRMLGPVASMLASTSLRSAICDGEGPWLAESLGLSTFTLDDAVVHAGTVATRATITAKRSFHICRSPPTSQCPENHHALCIEHRAGSVLSDGSGVAPQNEHHPRLLSNR